MSNKVKGVKEFDEQSNGYKQAFYYSNGVVKYDFSDDNKKSYVALVQLGHAGNGYYMLKLVDVIANSPEHLKEVLINLPRVKSGKENFILCYKEVSRNLWTYIKYINTSVDKFMGGTANVDNSDYVRNTRIILPSVANQIVDEMNRYIKSGHPEMVDSLRKTFKCKDDYSENDIFERLYGPEILCVGTRDSQRLEVRYDRPNLNNDILYEYCKTKAREVFGRKNIYSSKKFMVLMLYSFIAPEFKEQIKKDPNPLEVYFEDFDFQNPLPSQDRILVVPTNEMADKFAEEYVRTNKENGKDDLSDQELYEIRREYSSHLNLATNSTFLPGGECPLDPTMKHYLLCTKKNKNGQEIVDKVLVPEKNFYFIRDMEGSVIGEDFYSSLRQPEEELSLEDYKKEHPEKSPINKFKARMERTKKLNSKKTEPTEQERE